MPYEIIYADPPWTYKDKAHAGQRGVEYKYSTLSLDELKSLPVARICAKHSALFLWVTCPLLPQAFELITAWGFKYKTVAFVWVKKNRRNEATLFWGMGNWTRANAELCLLAVRGKPKCKLHNVHQIVEHKVMRHSEKPHEVRKRIRQLMGNDVTCLELFARHSIIGWDAWGDDCRVLVAQTHSNAVQGHLRAFTEVVAT